MSELERRLVLILEEYDELSELGNPSEERIKTSKVTLSAVADAVERETYLTVNDPEYQKAFSDAIKQVVKDLRTQTEGKEN